MMDDASAKAAACEERFSASGGELLRDIWYVAMTAGELKAGKLHKKMFLNEPVVMGRAPDGTPFALRDICPHRAVPLSWLAFSHGRRRLRAHPLAGGGAVL